MDPEVTHLMTDIYHTLLVQVPMEQGMSWRHIEDGSFQAKFKLYHPSAATKGTVEGAHRTRAVPVSQVARGWL